MCSYLLGGIFYIEEWLIYSILGIQQSDSVINIFMCVLFFSDYLLVYLPGDYHRQRNLAGYSPRGHKSWIRLSD